jgi:hypothetical protein
MSEQALSTEVKNPAVVISDAQVISKELSRLVDDRKLYTVISGKKYVQVAGWSALGAMMGILPREVSVVEHESGDIEAVVELIRASDGAVVGRGSALLGIDEKTWASRPRYAKRSMAITRATGKAFRLGFSWIMSLAGYAATPAEEMDGVVVEGELNDQPDDAIFLDNDRPYAPVTLQSKFSEFFAKNTGKNATDKQKKFYRIIMEQAVQNRDMIHAMQKFLTSFESSKDMQGVHFLAFLEWLKPERAGSGFVPCELALKEGAELAEYLSRQQQ